jgi:DNA-binding HxlR family transcriptional regulator
MARRYDQYCGLATVLDTVGDRWTLLIVRELLAGPRRYGDLLDGIPGVPTDMLAARLRHLEADGLVRQEPSAADGRMRVYSLTDEGRELEASLLALARFGLRRLGPDDEGLAFRTHWLGLAVRALYRPGALDGELRVRFVCDDEAWQVRIGDDGVVDDGTGDPDVTVEGRPGVLLTAVRDPGAARALLATGELRVSGAAADVRRFRAAFRAAR